MTAAPKTDDPIPQDKTPALSPKINLPHQVFRLPRKVLLLFIAIAVVIIAVFIALNSQNKTDKGSYKYTYNKLNSYHLVGKYTGTGADFTKPVEFTGKHTLDPGIGDKLQLSHQVTKGKQTTAIGGVDLVVVNPISSMPAAYVQSLHENKSLPFQVLSSDYKKFLDKQVGPNYTVTLKGTLQPLTTTNIKADAWHVDFTAASKDRAKPDHQGSGLLVVGHHAIYYFMLESINYNWQPNQKIWPKVIDSLKIDQP